ncbi:MAG: hypothetical protein IKS32_12695 [Solobacterium sp.]|nr:hypothetical protein [Solobacterium sp.]
MGNDKLNLTEDQINQIIGGASGINMPTDFSCPECGSNSADSGPLHNTDGVVYRKYVCRNCGFIYEVAIGRLRPRKTDDHG